ncbi:MAG: arginine repressor [Ignavibacteriales bacterium]
MKTRRHLAIMDIINNQKVSTQEELGDVLIGRGFNVTQATLSRDIHDLKLIKVPSDSGYRYGLADAQIPRGSLDRMKRLFNDAVIAITDSENLVVVKTLPGMANSVAATIDSAEIPEIVGTVAGDDTIIVVVKPMSAVSMILKRFDELIK